MLLLVLRRTRGQRELVPRKCLMMKALAPTWYTLGKKVIDDGGSSANPVQKKYYRYGGGEEVILCLYVDNILVFGTNLNVIEEVSDFLSKSLDMKDLRVVHVILNIKLRDGHRLRAADRASILTI